MVNKDILGGLKVALSRGDSLQSAMQSFYNAGYTKEEIEEAARALTSEISQQQYYQRQNMQQPMPQRMLQKQTLLPKPTQLLQTSQGQRVPPPKIQRIAPEIKPTSVQLEQQKIQTQPPKVQEPQTQIQQIKYVPPQLQQNQEEIQATRQIVSNYSQESSKYTIDFITIMLIAILLILLGILAAVFFFKPQLVEFLNKFLE
jgi:nitrogen fixation/metabolism regulation signal transduction histidine kinase